MKILIADDHPVFRRGLKETLMEAFPKATFAEARTAQETLDVVRHGPWGILVLDISMPGRSGLDILKEVKNLQPRLPVLFVSMHPEEQYARRALRSGAAGYLTKDSVPDELKAAVRKVASGGRYVSGALAERLASDLSQGTDAPAHELLSDREFQILQMVASGKSVKEIAGELALSVKTVSTYRARIVRKTGLSTTAGLIRYALKAQLVD